MDLKEIYNLLNDYEMSLSTNWKNHKSNVDENGVVHLINEDGHEFAMMTLKDYEDIIKYINDLIDPWLNKPWTEEELIMINSADGESGELW